MRVAVVGAGISGLIAARMLHDAGRDVTLYEAAPRLGGHAHTAEARFPDGHVEAVDVGFIVYNERNYPNLIKMFDALGVETQPSDMSFSASLDDGALEYAGSVRGWLAQPSNLLRRRYWRMTADIIRFFRTAKTTARNEDENRSLGDWLRDEGYSDAFIDDHLLPMAAAIWSCPCETMLGFPVRSFLKFFDNHALLEFRDRPRWRTVSGGSRAYVTKLAAPLRDQTRLNRPVESVRRVDDGVMVADRAGERRYFDALIFATHADRAAVLLADPDRDEADIIGQFSTQPNHAILHSDPSLMPKRKAAWTAWNYIADGDARDRRVSVTYWMNALQGFPEDRPLFVSLNPAHEPDPALVHGRYDFAHPAFDSAAINAQGRLAEIQGRNRIWWCGAWSGYGFHEDGMRSGMAAAAALGGVAPWEVEPRSTAGPVSPDRAAAAPDR